MQKYAKLTNIVIVADENFGIPRYGSNGDDLIDLELFDFSRNSLEIFKANSLSITIILPGLTTDSNLSIINKLFPDCKLMVYDNDINKTIGKLAELMEPASTIFVSGDLVMRSVALSNGFQSLPHVSVAALNVLEPIHFVLLSSYNGEFGEIGDLVPYHLERDGSKGWLLLAAMSDKSITQAIKKELV